MDTTTTPTTTDAFHRAATKALIAIARKNETLTADDVWDKIPADQRPTEPRAMGGFMLSAASQKVIQATDKTRKSTRRRSYTRVWESLIFGK